MIARFTAAEFTAATSGYWRNGAIPAGALAISTDTRIDNCGKIFLALKGEKFDAHDFLDRAVESRCSAICAAADKLDMLPPDIPVLVVDDTLKALQDCALFHRRRFPDLTVLGVTGSVGKTSVKEMLRAICCAAVGNDAVLCTEGNTNNQIGVAQNLLKLTSAHRYAVLEAGTSSPGEIAPLGRIIQPAGAIVNSIAPCHLENLIDLHGVALEKGELLRAVPAGGTAVFPVNAPEAATLRETASGHKICTFGTDGDGDFSAFWHSGTLDGSSFELRFPDGTAALINWHLTGSHNALNAAGAAALAYNCGISVPAIIAGLPQTTLPGMRMKRTVVDGVTYFNDAYNANPASMQASLTMLSQAELDGKLILVLGGMRELGKISASAHTQVLELAKKLLPEAEILTVGTEFAGISPHHFDSPEAAKARLAAIVTTGDTVFAKGSRGNAVEKVLPQEAQ